MKRFLVLLLVLCLASTANATLKYLMVADGGTETTPLPTPGQDDYYIPGDSTVELVPSDLLWIGVYNAVQGDAADLGQESMFLSIADNGGGEWTGQWVIYGTVGDPGYQDFFNEYLGKEAQPGIDLWQLNMTHAAVDYVGVGVVDAKLFHCTEAGIEVEVVLYDSSGTPVDSFIVHQTPEPMTIALLGLGGLFLRRRK